MPRHSRILGLRLCRDSRLMQHCDLPQSLSRLKLPATPPTACHFCGYVDGRYLLIICSSGDRCTRLSITIASDFGICNIDSHSFMYCIYNIFELMLWPSHTHTVEFASSLLQLSSPRQSIGKIVGAALIKLINKWKRCAEWRDKWRLTIWYSASIHSGAREWICNCNWNGQQLSPKRKARGETLGKLGKLISLRVHALSAAWELLTPLSLWLPMGCASSQGDVRSTPCPGERHLKREREREGETLQHGLQIEIGQMN